MGKTSLALLLILGVAGASRAADDAQALVNKAIQAAGGEERLAKIKGLSWKETGKYYGMGEGLDYRGNYTAFGSDKFRMEIEGIFTMVVNGDKGWMEQGGNAVDMEAEQLAQQKEDRYAAEVARLLPLLKDKAYTLGVAGEAVKVSRQGRPDIKLFFDKKTGLLVKTERKAKAAEQGNQEVNQETFLSEHKEVDGVKVATKVVIKRDGKNYIEAELSDLKFVDKLDEKLFSKP